FQQAGGDCPPSPRRLPNRAPTGKLRHGRRATVACPGEGADPMDAQTATASRRAPSRGQRVVLLALAGAATALALLGHRGVAALAPATRLDGLDNVFLAALLLGLAVLDGMGRLLPEGGAPGARRLRRALWLAFAA